MYTGRSILVPFILFVLICGFGGFPPRSLPSPKQKVMVAGTRDISYSSLLTGQETEEKKLGTGQELFLQPSIVPLYDESIKRPGQNSHDDTTSGNAITDIPWGILYLPSIS